MIETSHVVFGPFHLDLTNERLLQGTQQIRLTHKAFAVLQMLVTQPGTLITKDRFFADVWAGAAVTDSALTVCIRELRRALGDTAQSPRFIQTVHRRGYCFIAQVVTVPPVLESQGLPDISLPADQRAALLQPVTLVGRDAEWAQLHQWFTTAQEGTCQIGFLAGEPGIGKTALIETFVSHLMEEQPLWLGYGQCIEHYGKREPYLPLLEAFGRLCRGPGGSHLTTLLWHTAPSWLAQMPALLTLPERRELAVTTSGSTQVRMLRELTEALHKLTAERPLVLILEDVHWSDQATLDWLSYVAKRRERQRLLILSAYRPSDILASASALLTVVAELSQKELCHVLWLEALSPKAVAAYITQRLGTPQVPAGLADLLAQRTRGNPFFMRTILEELLYQGSLREQDGGWKLAGTLDEVATLVPTGARTLIEQQFDRLPLEAQELLEAASVTGALFSVEAVAAGSGQQPDAIARQCDLWTRHRHFVEVEGLEVWPDGTRTVTYRFRHDLYHEVLYERLSAWRRMHLHHAIGMYKEAGYRAHAAPIAAELARHFAYAHDAPRAVKYLHHAATLAAQRSAHPEAIHALSHALTLLERLAPSPTRDQQASHLHTALGMSFTATRGWASPEAQQSYEHAWNLCQQLEVTPERAAILYGLCSCSFLRGDLYKAQDFAERMSQVAQHCHDTAIQMQAFCMLGGITLYLGDSTLATTYLTHSLTLYTPQQRLHYIGGYGIEPGVIAASVASWALWLQGDYAQSLHYSQQALALAQDAAHALSRGFASMFAAWLGLFRRDEAAAQAFAETTITLGHDHGFPLLVAEGRFIQGRALLVLGAVEQGITAMVEGLQAYKGTGAGGGLTMFLALLADGYVRVGRVADGMKSVTEGLTISQRTGEHWWTPELQRLYGHLLLMQMPADEWQAEVWLQQALTKARQQQTKMLELRAAVSLARLWQHQGKRHDARDLLASVYTTCTTSFTTVDGQEANALLTGLDFLKA